MRATAAHAPTIDEGRPLTLSRTAATLTTALAASALALSALTAAPATAGATTVSVTHRAAAPTSLPARAGLTAPGQVAVGSKIKVSGKVAVHRGTRRKVGLLESRGGRWVLLSTRRTTRKGAFAFSVAAGSKVGDRRMAVVAPRARGVKAYRKRFVVTVTATTPPVTTAPTTATAALDRPATTTYAAPLTMSGTVGGALPANRLVVVEQALPNGWVELARTTSGATGAYAVALPADFAWTSAVRASVPAVPGATAAVSGESTASVAPSWALPGDPNAYSFLGGTRARWNPCAPIRVKVNYAQAPLASTRAHVEQALAHVRAASGLAFTITGDTNAYAWPAPGYPGADAETDLLISFGTQVNTTAAVTGGTIGMGGPTYYTTSDSAGPVGLITKGQVFVDVNPAEATITDAVLANVLRHEIAHAVGAGHSQDSTQVMYPMVTPATTFGAGDFTVLNRYLGRAAGCLTMRGVNARAVPHEVAAP
ncbi:matrixin family metalloprotease [Nocardioides sp. Soil774]|uniref:matrixin family metalloprotease n=1 Tax=Nocardioides sp. Soil774 TaxID=1736408 RepID=UPI000AC79D53|nr:matrixin family metalloprotease [Nocardioides sp. Soil774]